MITRISNPSIHCAEPLAITKAVRFFIPLVIILQLLLLLMIMILIEFYILSFIFIYYYYYIILYYIILYYSEELHWQAIGYLEGVLTQPLIFDSFVNFNDSGFGQYSPQQMRPVYKFIEDNRVWIKHQIKEVGMSIAIYIYLCIYMYISVHLRISIYYISSKIFIGISRSNPIYLLYIYIYIYIYVLIALTYLFLFFSLPSSCLLFSSVSFLRRTCNPPTLR